MAGRRRDPVRQLRAVYHFDVTGLFTRRELLGTSRELVYQDWPLAISFPPLDRSTPASDGAAWPMWHSGGPWGAPSTGDEVNPEDPDAIVTVNVVRVTTELEADVPTEPLTLAADLLRKRAEIPRAAVAELLAWARVSLDQWWLGFAHKRPRLVRAYLFDATGKALVQVEDPLALYVPQKESALSQARFAQISQRVEAREIAPLPETLLADARFALWDPHENPDVSRGVLLAAIAGEVKVKKTLRAKVEADRLPLLDLLLDNPREVTLQARYLFDRVAKVITGKSLRKDDHGLYKRVERLFEMRNRLAHYGETPDSKEGVDCIAAMGQAFAWLDSLSSPESKPKYGTRPSESVLMRVDGAPEASTRGDADPDRPPSASDGPWRADER